MAGRGGDYCGKPLRRAGGGGGALARTKTQRFGEDEGPGTVRRVRKRHTIRFTHRYVKDVLQSSVDGDSAARWLTPTACLRMGR